MHPDLPYLEWLQSESDQQRALTIDVRKSGHVVKTRCRSYCELVTDVLVDMLKAMPGDV